MDADERDIFQYLKTWGKEYVGVVEICRRAGSKQRYRQDPDWAVPYLGLMVERGILERDAAGRFRIKPRKKLKSGTRWVSPEIAEILNKKAGELKEKGVEVDVPDEHIASDEEYDQL
ncbi:MAG TPA: hypothetical protein VFF11_16670 [Candidatus Binatia bacterium]|nr:hypothetical protein [Candidatus Binatia bacterium]